MAFDTEHSLTDYSIDDYLAERNQCDIPEKQKSAEEKARAYKMASILWDHDEKHGLHENVIHTVTGLETTILLDLVHGFRYTRPSDDFLLDFVKMLIVDMRRLAFNVFGWQCWADAECCTLSHIAYAQCLVGSLINHSCVPNTTWEFNDAGVIQFTANRYG